MKFYRQYSRLIPVFVILLVLQACSGSQSQQKSQSGGQRGQRGGRGNGEAVHVKGTAPQRIAIQRVVELSGNLISPDQVRVSGEVDGTVSSVDADLGQEVQAGQILIQLDTQELRLAVERAESALRQTEAQLGIDTERPNVIPPDEQIASVRTAIANREDARVKLALTQELVNKGLSARTDLDTNETRLKVAEASVQSALENVRSLKASLQDRRASYELAKKKVADASIRAPASGSISERLVQKGEFIRANTPVAVIVQLNPLKLQTAVQEKYANLIRRGLVVHFTVESFPGERLRGARFEHQSLSNSADSDRSPWRSWFQIPSGKLRPGYFAKGTILTQKDENVLAVPQEAVSTLAGVSSVFVVEDGAVRQQNVTLGMQEGQPLGNHGRPQGHGNTCGQQSQRNHDGNESNARRCSVQDRRRVTSKPDGVSPTPSRTGRAAAPSSGGARRGFGGN